MRPTLSLVIPAYNEDKRIGETLRRVGSYFSTISGYRRLMMPLPVEVIVVVNNSTDRTHDIVDLYARKYPFIRVVTVPFHIGKGGAIALGFELALGEYIAFIDADGSSSPREIMKLFEALSSSHSDIAIGNRYSPQSLISGNIPLARTIFSRLFNFFGVKAFFGLPYKDTQCGLKLFTAEAAKNLAKRYCSGGWTFDLNLLLLAKHLGYTVIEVPTVWIYREGSTLRFSEALSSVSQELLSLKWMELKLQMNRISRLIALGCKPQTQMEQGDSSPEKTTV